MQQVLLRCVAFAIDLDHGKLTTTDVSTLSSRPQMMYMGARIGPAGLRGQDSPTSSCLKSLGQLGPYPNDSGLTVHCDPAAGAQKLAAYMHSRWSLPLVWHRAAAACGCWGKAARGHAAGAGLVFASGGKVHGHGKLLVALSALTPGALLSSCSGACLGPNRPFCPRTHGALAPWRCCEVHGIGVAFILLVEPVAGGGNHGPCGHSSLGARIEGILARIEWLGSCGGLWLHHRLGCTHNTPPQLLRSCIHDRA